MWELAVAADRRLRARPAARSRLEQRAFVHDILIAATAREIGAAIITMNVEDFAVIGRHLDIRYVLPWPVTAAA